MKQQASSRKEYMKAYRERKKMASVTSITPSQNNTQQAAPLITNTPNQSTQHAPVTSINPPVTNSANTAPVKVFDVKKALLFFLVLCGSFFLVAEQVIFYEALGYSFSYSVFLAVLLETTPLALAYFAGVTKDVRLYYAIFPAVLCIGAVIFLGLRVRLEKSENTAKISTILEEQLASLKEEAKEAEGKALKKSEKDIFKKQDELMKQLAVPQSNDANWQLWAFALIRFLAFCYNLIFARLLATLHR